MCTWFICMMWHQSLTCNMIGLHREIIAESGKAGKLSPYFVPRILANMGAGLVSLAHGLRGPNHAVSTACTTGAHAVGDAANFIKLGAATVRTPQLKPIGCVMLLKAMLAGATEACVNAISLAGFSRCRALATSFNSEPAAASRPFDADREGFVMGEGCGMLLLESLTSAQARKARIYAEVLGYGLSGDAFHLTAPDESGKGARAAMRKALGDVDPAAVGYVNAHATSTPVGDAVEAGAIGAIIGPGALVGSSKGALGHLLGAAGSAEAALTVLALFHGLVPPNLNLSRPIETTATLAPADKASPFPQLPGQSRRLALSNSFGFGGTNASLLLASFP